jgi:hypothetical protein
VVQLLREILVLTGSSEPQKVPTQNSLRKFSVTVTPNPAHPSVNAADLQKKKQCVIM